MRVAVPSDDQVTISAHTGRCAGFLIFSIEDHLAKKEEYRTNTAGHAHHHGVENHAEDHHHHSHDGMIGLLKGCDTVLAAGMGPRLVNDLEAEGLQVIFTYETDAAKAVEALAQGKLIRGQVQSRCGRH
jgi:predicted Fe-Mo cluster-binding NifX family protein